MALPLTSFAQEASNKTDGLFKNDVVANATVSGLALAGEVGAAYKLFTTSLEFNPIQREILKSLEADAKEAKKAFQIAEGMQTKAYLQERAVPEIVYTYPSLGDPQYAEFQRTGIKNYPVVNNNPEIYQAELVRGNYYLDASEKKMKVAAARKLYRKACAKVSAAKIQHLTNLSLLGKGIRVVRYAGGIALLVDATQKAYYWASTGEAPSPIPFSDTVGKLFNKRAN